MKKIVIPKALATILVAIFIFDCAVMPVIKIGSLSFKMSYIIAIGSVGYYLLTRWSVLQRKNHYIDFTICMLVAYACLVAIGELDSVLFFGVSVSNNFYKVLIGCVLMIGSLYYGFCCRLNIGNIVFWAFIANAVVNSILALLGTNAPAFMLKLYSISVDTFIDGYYRNGGIIGNPNSSLLVTNIILLALVLLYRFDKLKLGSIRIALVYLVSLAADIIVSSRGELLHSIILLVYFTYWVFKKTKNPTLFLVRMGSIAVVLTVGIVLFNTTLVSQFENIQTSMDRMDTLESITDTTASDASTSSIMRPFFKFSVFSKRFPHSPVWGTGIDGGGNHADYIKGTTGYHNDIFMILGAAGILGLIAWFLIIKNAVKHISICFLSPFMITAISNTFIQSYFGTMLFFFIMGYCYRNCSKKASQSHGQKSPSRHTKRTAVLANPSH